MPVSSSEAIVASGQAYVQSDSGLCCARCYVSHGLVCPLTYRYAPTWGFSPRMRWVETFSCSFCRNEINDLEARLPISLLDGLIESGGRFYDRLTGQPFTLPVEVVPE